MTGLHRTDEHEICILKGGDETALEAFLLPRIESSMFLLGNMRSAGLADSGQRFGGTYAAAWESGRIVGVVAHYWNGNLVFQAPQHLEELWRAAVRASGRGIKGLLGPGAQVEAARLALAPVPGNVQMDETEKLYYLRLEDLIVPADLAAGRVRARRAGPQDVELLSRWRVGLNVESLHGEDGPTLRKEVRSAIERSVGEGREWLLEAEGQPVATTAFNASTREAVQVGGVYTPPELRGRGYARAAVAASLLEARAAGATVAILFTGPNNLAAQRAYGALGFVEVGEYRLLLLREAVAGGS